MFNFYVCLIGRCLYRFCTVPCGCGAAAPLKTAFFGKGGFKNSGKTLFLAYLAKWFSSTSFHSTSGNVRNCEVWSRAPAGRYHRRATCGTALCGQGRSFTNVVRVVMWWVGFQFCVVDTSITPASHPLFAAKPQKRFPALGVYPSTSSFPPAIQIRFSASPKNSTTVYCALCTVN